ncbi:hypothetical protein U8P73_36120 (plasmid) [Rhizobium beringeri]|uniref:hypothetical protein n=1 Tax=Rhizobium beringeri TaxID=3019934 RepID=UPI002DDDA794|nr:hypothetical protein [Rhizobium beringeri]WSG93577.1 hypothetical protein U8P73_36120 [Rhizobium beringeri]
MSVRLRPILQSHQRYREDFIGYGIPKPEQGFYVNVYRHEIGSEYEHMELGNIWANRKEAQVSAKGQVKGRRDSKCAYRIRVKPKGPIPNRPRPEPFPPRGFYPPFYFHGPCMCQSRSIRSFR